MELGQRKLEGRFRLNQPLESFPKQPNAILWLPVGVYLLCLLSILSRSTWTFLKWEWNTGTLRDRMVPAGRPRDGPGEAGAGVLRRRDNSVAIRLSAQMRLVDNYVRIVRWS